MPKPKTFAVCHPDQRNYSRGSCKTCSIKSRYQKRDKVGEKTRLRQWANTNNARVMWFGAKKRAKAKNLDFNITVEDIVIPAVCPVLNIPLVRAEKYRSDNSPSLDRIHNEKGYVKGNIIVVSNRANQLKSNGTLEELRQIIDFYSRYG